jgi:hypothetical protein
MGIFRTVVEKAAQNKEFRAALSKDPKGAIEKEFGVEFPKDVAIHVHENSAKVVHVVLPNPLELSERRPLTKEELEQVAGGQLRSRFATLPCTNTWC